MSSLLPTPDVSPRPGLPPFSPCASPLVRPKTKNIHARSSASQPCRSRNLEAKGSPLVPATQPRLGTIADSVSNALRRAKSSGQILASNILDSPAPRLRNSMAVVVFPIARPNSSPIRTPKKKTGLVIQSRSTPESVPRTKTVSLPASASTFVSKPELAAPPRPHGTYAMCEECHGTGWNHTAVDSLQSHAPYPTPDPYSTPAPPYTAILSAPPYPSASPYMAPGPSTTPDQFSTPALAQFATPTRARKRYTGAKPSTGLRLSSIGASGFGPDKRARRGATVRAGSKGKKSQYVPSFNGQQPM